MTRGIEANVVERFSAGGIAAGNVSVKRDTFVFESPGAPSGLVDAFGRNLGPTMNALEAAEKSVRAEAMLKELEDLYSRQRTSADKDWTQIAATLLCMTVAV